MASHPKVENVNKGKLHLYAETGTEGGYWAFQDQKYIYLSKPSGGIANQLNVWDKNYPDHSGIFQETELLIDDTWVPLPDPLTLDPDYFISSLYCGQQKGDRLADERLSLKYKFDIHYREGQNDNRTPKTLPSRPYGVPEHGLTRGTVRWDSGKIEHDRLADTLLIERWAYKGLHILKNGDALKIFHPEDNSIAWNGIVALKPHPPFSQQVNGHWIHADPIGIERSVWAQYFLNNYPAALKIHPP